MYFKYFSRFLEPFSSDTESRCLLTPILCDEIGLVIGNTASSGVGPVDANTAGPVDANTAGPVDANTAGPVDANTAGLCGGNEAELEAELDDDECETVVALDLIPFQ